MRRSGSRETILIDFACTRWFPLETEIVYVTRMGHIIRMTLFNTGNPLADFRI